MTCVRQHSRSARQRPPPPPCPCARPDKYETVQVAALLHQLLAHGGFYDEALEFVRLERVQVTHPTQRA